jgi:hypothetical protein
VKTFQPKGLYATLIARHMLHMHTLNTSESCSSKKSDIQHLAYTRAHAPICKEKKERGEGGASREFEDMKYEVGGLVRLMKPTQDVI